LFAQRDMSRGVSGTSLLHELADPGSDSEHSSDNDDAVNDDGQYDDAVTRADEHGVHVNLLELARLQLRACRMFSLASQRPSRI
jgi:hypothetical protein